MELLNLPKAGILVMSRKFAVVSQFQMVGEPLLRHTAVQQHRRHRIRKHYQIRLKQSPFTTRAPRFFKIKLRGQCNRVSFRSPKRHRRRIGDEFNSSFNRPTVLELVHGGG
jgi:hypothetical protein